jgi:hypothetical protein
MFVLDAFKDRLTLEIRSVIQAMNTNIVVIPEGVDFITTYSSVDAYKGPFETTIFYTALSRDHFFIPVKQQ